MSIPNRMGMKLASKLEGTMGMKLASKFNGMLMVKSKLLELIKEVCMLPLCRIQLLSGPHVLTVNDFKTPLISIQLAKMSHAISYAGPLWGAMPAT
eukprot:1159518-Pelagomonas_calceolata.AAC.10